MANQLNANVESGRVKAEGCCTPKEDKAPQKVCVPPKRVLPIIFLPGIMGSNLRLMPDRQKELKKSNNIAWRPDKKLEAKALINASPRERQMQLDPGKTEVDIYDPINGTTGTPKETPGERHCVKLTVNLNVGVDTALLIDDPVGSKGAKTKAVKAMERGWGEVYYSSYQSILEHCEQHLNSPNDINFWKQIFGQDPKVWGAHPPMKLQPLTENEYKKSVEGCWFPVHAIGYNWLKSNTQSALEVKARILTLIKKYQEQEYQCEKVILVTHSMGGLLARALIHPKIGGLEEQVLGIVHGVMPATGSPAAYRRMRCGTEESLSGLNPAPKVMGNYGSEVTAVLGNAQGGLELLPSKAYGNGWLEIKQKGQLLKKLPEHGDPYLEIYQLQGKWYRLLREEWINPAELNGRGFGYTCELLKGAKEFHETISATYHSVSYAHYGADSERPSWERVTWDLDPKYAGKNWNSLRIYSDQRHGEFRLYEGNNDIVEDLATEKISVDGAEFQMDFSAESFLVKIGDSIGPGDQTVPLRSSEHQLLCGSFSGIFRQVGYEHQGSYKNRAVIHSTLYSLIRIASTMKWSCNE